MEVLALELYMSRDVTREMVIGYYFRRRCKTHLASDSQRRNVSDILSGCMIPCWAQKDCFLNSDRSLIQLTIPAKFRPV